jgi:hypothetical protein
MLASGGSTVVEYSPHHPKVEGSSPTNADDTGEKWQKLDMLTVVCCNIV